MRSDRALDLPRLFEVPIMTAAYLILVSSVLGQSAYYPMGSYAPAYGIGAGNGYGNYWRTPLPSFDPMRYNRFST
jgi:hypothetical protein